MGAVHNKCPFAELRMAPPLPPTVNQLRDNANLVCMQKKTILIVPGNTSILI